MWACPCCLFAEGATAVVYAATDKQSGRHVALKVKQLAPASNAAHQQQQQRQHMASSPAAFRVITETSFQQQQTHGCCMRGTTGHCRATSCSHIYHCCYTGCAMWEQQGPSQCCTQGGELFFLLTCLQNYSLPKSNLHPTCCWTV